MAKLLSKCKADTNSDWSYFTDLSLTVYNRLFIERNDEFAMFQDAKFGPIHQDMNMKTCKLKEDSISMLKLSKQ